MKNNIKEINFHCLVKKEKKKEKKEEDNNEINKVMLSRIFLHTFWFSKRHTFI